MKKNSLFIVVAVLSLSGPVWACRGGKCGILEKATERSVAALDTLNNPAPVEPCSTPATPQPISSFKLIKCSEEAPGQPEDKCLEQHQWKDSRGKPNCREEGAKSPLFEMVELNPGYFVIRQNKCSSFEAPFMYFVMGETGAFLHDSGAADEAGENTSLELRKMIDELIARKEKQTGKTIQLTVGHGHSHGDHVHGDGAFRDRPNTRVVGLSPQAISEAYGIKPSWPDGQGEVDLGGRKLTVIPIPGHERSSVAFYDNTTKDMFSGDSLYPGNVFVNGSWQTHRASTARLSAFVEKHPVRMILGSHVEMQNKPGQDYEYGTSYQPDEHSLVLRQQNLKEMNDFMQATPSEPREKKVFDDFMVVP